MKIARRIFFSFGFWMGILGVLLVLGREFVYMTASGETFMLMANFPLTAAAHILFPGILIPVPDGGTFSHTQVVVMYLPYYILYVLTYIGYGLAVDCIIRRVKKSANARRGDS